METMMNDARLGATAPAAASQQDAASPAPRRFGRSGDGVVRWAEFQLALWIGAFALTAILGGFTFLYTAIADLRVSMEAQHAETRKEIRAEMQAELGHIRTETQTKHDSLRTEMQTGYDSLRTEMQTGYDRLRTEMQTGYDRLRTEMQTKHEEVRAEIREVKDKVDYLDKQLTEVRERVIRIETRLDAAAMPAAVPPA